MSRNVSPRTTSPVPDQLSIDAYGQGRHYGKQWLHTGATAEEIDNLASAWSDVEPSEEDVILGTRDDDAFGAEHRVYQMITGLDHDDISCEEVRSFLDAYAAHVDEEVMTEAEFWRGFIRGALGLPD